MDKYQGHWDKRDDQRIEDDLRRLRLLMEKPPVVEDPPRSERPEPDGRPDQ